MTTNPSASRSPSDPEELEAAQGKRGHSSGQLVTVSVELDGVSYCARLLRIFGTGSWTLTGATPEPPTKYAEGRILELAIERFESEVAA